MATPPTARRRLPISRTTWTVRCGTALATLAASLTSVVTPAAAAGVDDGLVLRYRLDERSGTVAADTSGNHRDGVVSGSPDWTPGQGLGFNGSTTQVKAPDDVLKGLDSVSVAMDVLIDPELSGPYFIYGFGNTAGNGWGNGYLFTGGNDFRTSVSTANWTAEQNTRPNPARNLARGTFKHVAYTQTGTTGVLYEDGVEVGRNTGVTIKPGAIGDGHTTANYLGRSLYTADARFKGRLRDFRVYDRALSATEVGQLAADTAAQGVARDAAALSLGDTSGVTDDLTLPAPGAYGSTITWSSSDPSVLSTTGKVTRPAGGRPDAKVTLTATLRRGAAQDTKRFTVTVLAEFDDSTKVDRAAKALAVPNLGDVRGNLTLPTRGTQGTTVTWTSDRPSVIAPDGVVNRGKPGTDPVRVNLTATVRLNAAETSRTFEATVPPLPVAQPLKGYLFSYFTGEGKANGEQIYAALSRGNNALRFRELGGGQPVLTSTLGEKGLRDPFIIRSPEGDKFFQIATDLRIYGNGNWDAAQRTGSKSIMVWESTDLVNWTDQRLVKVSPDTAGNTWAPEAFYDRGLGAYVVFWASKIYAENDPEHRGDTYNKMMYATTRDFVTFTPAKVWNDPGYSVIDSTVVQHNGVYHRFTKDERGATSGNPCGKFIIQQKSTALLDPDYDFVADCIGKGTLGAAEGPSIVKSNIAEKWYLYLDEFGGRGYVPFESTDLDSGRWTPSTGYDLPASPRHGTVLPVTQAEYDRLLRRYVPGEVVDSIKPEKARTLVGQAPILRDLVEATFADGSTRTVGVTWQKIPPEKYAAPGTFTVSGVIAESSTVKAEATVTVYEKDSADAGPDTGGAEGAPIALAGTATGEGDRGWAYAKVSGVDSGAKCTFADATAAATTVTCTDDGTYEMKLRAGDVADTARVTVTNAAPTVGAVRVSGSPEAGRPVTISAPVADPGTNDALTCTVTFGDGGTAAGTIADGTCAATHTYAAPGGYDVVVTVADDDLATAAATVRVAVAPVRSVDAGPDATGTEGSAVALRGVVTGGGTPTWTYQAGSGVDAGARCTFADPHAATTAVTCTDDGTYEVTLTVDDRSDRGTVTVGNAGPVIVADEVPAAARTGVAVPVRVRFTDAGGNDTHTCVVDFGDGRPASGTVSGGDCTARHTYTAPGTYTVAVTVSDDDRGTATVRRPVTVAATVTAVAGPDVRGAEGAAIRLAGTATGAPSRWTYRAVAGVDSGTTCTFADAKAARTTLTCTDDGTFEVRLAAGAVADTARVTVTNAAPVLTSVPTPAPVSTGRQVSLRAVFTDAGGHDRHTCTVDWDGARSTGSVAAKVCTAGHTYRTAGTYDVRVTVTDDDGAAATRTLRVVVRATGSGAGTPGGLARTGSPIVTVAIVGLVLLLGGAVLLLLGRRRGRTSRP